MTAGKYSTEMAEGQQFVALHSPVSRRTSIAAGEEEPIPGVLHTTVAAVREEPTSDAPHLPVAVESARYALQGGWTLDFLRNFTCAGMNFMEVPRTCCEMCLDNFWCWCYWSSWCCGCCCCVALCKECCCCCCPDSTTFQAVTTDGVIQTLQYVDSTCCCPWTKVKRDAATVGSMRIAGPCDNGLLYYFCPFCVCGDVDEVYFRNELNDMALVVRRRNSPDLLSIFCDLLLIGFYFVDQGTYYLLRLARGVFRSLLACVAWARDCGNYCCCGRSIVVVSEDLFPSQPNLPRVGRLHTVEGLDVDSCCCVYRKPVRAAVTLDDNDLLLVASLLPAFQYGITTDSTTCFGCKVDCTNGGRILLCDGKPLPPATGTALDRGRYLQLRYTTFDKMLLLTTMDPETEVDGVVIDQPV